MVGSGILNGTVWHDAEFRQRARCHRARAGRLDRRAAAQRSARCVTTTTDAAGVYRIAGLVPNYQTQNRYDLIVPRARRGRQYGVVGTGGFRLQKRAAAHLRHSGAVRQQPAEPQSADRPRRRRLQLAVARAAVGGDADDCVDANSDIALPASCFDDPNQQGQVTRTDGYYKFDINFSDPSCPSGGSYAIDVVPPTPGYETGISRVIPPPRCRRRRRSTCRPARRVRDDAIPTTDRLLRTAGVRIRTAAERARAQRRHRVPAAPRARRQPACPVRVSCTTTICRSTRR